MSKADDIRKALHEAIDKGLTDAQLAKLAGGVTGEPAERDTEAKLITSFNEWAADNGDLLANAGKRFANLNVRDR